MYHFANLIRWYGRSPLMDLLPRLPLKGPEDQYFRWNWLSSRRCRGNSNNRLSILLWHGILVSGASVAQLTISIRKRMKFDKNQQCCKSSYKVFVALSKCHNDKYVHCTITMQCQLQHSKQVNKFLSADFYQYQNTESSLASPCSEWHVLELLFDSDDLYMWSQRASFGGIPDILRTDGGGNYYTGGMTYIWGKTSLQGITYIWGILQGA